MDSRDSNIEMMAGGGAHRLESGGSFKRYWNVRRTGCDHRNGGHVPFLARVANRHPRLRINRRQLAQHLPLLFTPPGRDSQLTRALENLPQVRARPPRTVAHFRNSGARLAVAIQA